MKHPWKVRTEMPEYYYQRKSKNSRFPLFKRAKSLELGFKTIGNCEIFSKDDWKPDGSHIEKLFVTMKLYGVKFNGYLHIDMGQRIDCPECNEAFISDYSREEREGSTMDCPCCNALLVFMDYKTLGFHKYMNSQYSDWPEDGEGTGHIDI